MLCSFVFGVFELSFIVEDKLEKGEKKKERVNIFELLAFLCSKVWQ